MHRSVKDHPSFRISTTTSPATEVRMASCSFEDYRDGKGEVTCTTLDISRECLDSEQNMKGSDMTQTSWVPNEWPSKGPCTNSLFNRP